MPGNHTASTDPFAQEQERKRSKGKGTRQPLILCSKHYRPSTRSYKSFWRRVIPSFHFTGRDYKKASVLGRNRRRFCDNGYQGSYGNGEEEEPLDQLEAPEDPDQHLASGSSASSSLQRVSDELPLSNQAASDHIVRYHTTSDHAADNHAADNRAAGDHAGGNQATIDQATIDQATIDQAAANNYAEQGTTEPPVERDIELAQRENDMVSHPKGESPIELLPNEILHHIWFLSLSLDLPHSSAALSSKLSAKETKELFLRSWILRLPFHGRSLLAGETREISTCDAPLINNYLLSSRFFNDNLLDRLRKRAADYLGNENPQCSKCNRYFYKSRADLKLTGEVNIPFRFLEESVKQDNFFTDLFYELVRCGASPPPLNDTIQLLHQAISLGHSVAVHSWLRAYETGHLVAPSLLERVLSNPERSSGHLECVRAIMCAGLGEPTAYRRSPPRFHVEFLDFTNERHPCLWRWVEVNLRVGDIVPSEPETWKVSIRPIDLANDGERVDGRRVAWCLKNWACGIWRVE